MYLESLQDGEQFLEHVQKISQMDPVLVLSPGRNEAARHAMQLHTGAMASDDKVLDMALENAGALRCEGMEDMTDLLKAFSFEVAPKGPRVAVVSNAGGPGVITADAIEQNNLELAHIPQATKKKILKHLPRAASVMNPIDVLGDALATRYAKALELVLKLKSVDGAIVILTPQVMTQIKQTARAIGKVSKAYQKPILCAFMGGTLIHAGETVLTAAKIPNFRFPERAVKAFAQMWKWQQWKTKKQTQQKSTRSFIPQQQVHWVSDALHTHATGAFSSVESDEILQWADIQVPKTKALSGYADAKRFCEKHGYPVVLKISSREVIHKKDVGGVITDIVDEKMLKTALAQIKKQLQVLKVKDGKVQIQQQIESGIEVIVGIKRDSIFGPVLMIGAGGTLAELVDDMYLGFLPNNQVQVEEALKKTRIFRLLSGYRGGQKYDIKALIRLVLRLSDLVRRCEDIAEIEINPVMVTQKGAWALDGKIRKI